MPPIIIFICFIRRPNYRGIKIFGNEIKLSQFANDTNLFCADTISAENALRNSWRLWDTSWFKAKYKKVQRDLAWKVGKKNKLNPLQLKWPRTPVSILGTYASYDVKGNDDRNFNLKLGKLQTNLDTWRARDLTLFGRVLIIKSLGLSQIINFLHP